MSDDGLWLLLAGVMVVAGTVITASASACAGAPLAAFGAFLMFLIFIDSH